MPEIQPFRGILYDTKRVEASKVLAPPYDVIDAAGRAALAAKDPHNSVRLILPEGEGAARYQNAAQMFADWQKSGVLVRDDRPAVYRYHQVFAVPELGRTFRRRGFIAAVRLHDFSEAVILPHERTHKGPKADRLELMKATHAHFSQIFTLYSDPSGESDKLFRKVEDRKPDVDGTTDDGTQHQLWRVPDREIIGKLVHQMAALKLYIADGHHRYETMLALRDHFRTTAGPLNTHSEAEYGTLFLSNMNDTGLVVLPTHRIIHSVPNLDIPAVMAKAATWFEIVVAPGAARNPDALRAALAGRDATHPGFAVIVPNEADARIFTLRANLDIATAGVQVSRVLRDLDVTILHDLFLDKAVGLDRATQDAKTNLAYPQDVHEVIRRLAAGDAQLGIIMTPTRVDQVRAVADAHDFMPQKSTYFFPKLASGLVINPIDPTADLY